MADVELAHLRDCGDRPDIVEAQAVPGVDFQAQGVAVPRGPDQAPQLQVPRIALQVAVGPVWSSTTAAPSARAASS